MVLLQKNVFLILQLVESLQMIVQLLAKMAQIFNCIIQKIHIQRLMIMIKIIIMILLLLLWTN